MFCRFLQLNGWQHSHYIPISSEATELFEKQNESKHRSEGVILDEGYNTYIKNILSPESAENMKVPPSTFD